jgi:hypothetical protein
MTPYSIALFLHIVGALALFVALGLEGVVLFNLRRAATAEQVREWARVSGLNRRLSPASLGLILLAGLYMTVTTWKSQEWINTAFLTMLLLPVFGALNGRRLAAVGRSLATEQGPLPDAARVRLGDPFLTTSYLIRLAAALGIVFLMVVKPDLLGSVVTIGVALAAGLTISAPTWRLIWPRCGHFRVSKPARCGSFRSSKRGDGSLTAARFDHQLRLFSIDKNIRG